MSVQRTLTVKTVEDVRLSTLSLPRSRVTFTDGTVAIGEYNAVGELVPEWMIGRTLKVRLSEDDEPPQIFGLCECAPDTPERVCPYNEEINDDYTPCRCCGWCAHRCRMGV
jgi:hypothetical protein